MAGYLAGNVSTACTVSIFCIQIVGMKCRILPFVRDVGR